eukprot:515192-Prorocentrum_lima.AAC.1
MTNGRNETLTTTDIANAFLNTPINKDAAILVRVPNMLGRLGTTRTALYRLKESPGPCRKKEI